MPGSKTVADLELIYDALYDKAYWVLRSVSRTLENSQSHRWEVIEEGFSNYEVVSKLAGPKPVVLVEEVVQPKQGVDNETQEAE